MGGVRARHGAPLERGGVLALALHSAAHTPGVLIHHPPSSVASLHGGMVWHTPNAIPPCGGAAPHVHRTFTCPKEGRGVTDCDKLSPALPAHTTQVADVLRSRGISEDRVELGVRHMWHLVGA